MNFFFLIKGLVIGFSIAAPVGPIGVLCIRRTLAKGRASGFVSGLGAATADGFYGMVAAYGLTFISSFLIGEQVLFRLIGGVFLLYLGIRTFFSKPSEKQVVDQKGDLFNDYASTLLLTVMNPMTILSFAAIFAGLGLGDSRGNLVTASMMVAGVFFGSALWWFLLSGVVGLFRSKFSAASLRLVNRVSGVVIVAFAIAAFASLFA